MFLEAHILQPLIDVFNDVLKWLHNDVGLAWGLGIVLITWLSRLVVLPFTLKSMHGMREMQALQPYLKEIQEKYKDDKQRQQQEIMKLYKEEKVNPLAGCLPTFLQIPVFYALYKVLMVSVEMRHQPFVGWIHDLTAPDPASPAAPDFPALLSAAFPALGSSRDGVALEWSWPSGCRLGQDERRMYRGPAARSAIPVRLALPSPSGSRPGSRRTARPSPAHSAAGRQRRGRQSGYHSSRRHRPAATATVAHGG